MMDDLLQEMIDPAPVHHDAPRRRRLWTTVAIVGLAAIGATTLTTSAIFTDNDAASASISTGTVDLALGQPTTFAFDSVNLAPGDSTYAPIEVRSDGSLALRYSISYSASVTPSGIAGPTLAPAPTVGDLRDVLELSVFEVADAAGCSATTIGTATAVALHPDVATNSWPTLTAPLVGSSTQGDQPGDRELEVDTPSEWLCFKVDLPLLLADNSYQATGATLDLTFNAEQVVNNP
ncbi:hypothetical protein HP550_00525 [Cellulomonas humilata]|uniref:Uncharacterized protein n=1 Tax=Cellulomonas humilata TaxID=144055 RepID=A0A7Y5ZX82_9CELL|nr:TasA family protein [Cellulomonas humilata]NUU15734.1 hypothetical protein [Cellulomonas humilata]